MSGNWPALAATGLGLPNQAYAGTIPIANLSKAAEGMILMLDAKWQAVLGEVMPEAPTVKVPYQRPLVVDPQMIAEMRGPYGRTGYVTTGAKKETWFPSITTSGYLMEPMEMLEEYQPDFGYGTSEKMQHLAQICLRAIERRVELELVNYFYGNTECIESFSNQSTALLHDPFDITAATDGMNGYSWDDYVNSDPFEDIDNAIELQEGMGDQDLDHLFIGSKTAKVLKNHDVILDRIKYVRDTTGGTLNAFFGGLPNSMKIVKVTAHTYKDEAGNIGQIGSPGQGDLAAHTWTNENKYWFMRADGYEMAFLTGNRVGNVLYARCNQYHTKKTSVYSYTWVDHEPHFQRTRFEKNFCPKVDNFANEMVFTKVCPTTV